MTPRLAALLLAVTAIVGCQYFQQQEPRRASSAADIAACRKRADQIFEMQNRGAVYAADAYRTNDRDSPFTSNGLTGVTSQGLGAQYQRDQFEDDCLRSTNSTAPTQLQPAQPAGSPPSTHR